MAFAEHPSRPGWGAQYPHDHEHFRAPPGKCLKGSIMPTTPIIRFGILACIHLASMTGVGAAELSYALSSPLVGGNNNAPYQIETARNSQKKQIAAKAIADAKQVEYDAQAAINNSPTTRLANALQSQLFTQISMKMSDKILNSSEKGSFAFGDLFIGYEQIGGVIRVTINSPSGTSTLDLPK